MKKIIYISFLFLPFFSFSQNENANSAKTSDTSQKARQAAKDKLESIRQRVIKGESMATLATLYSEDLGSFKEGGLYKNIARGVFVPEFEEVAFRLHPGEVSEIFETQFGFHFIQLISKHDDLVDVRHILIVPGTQAK